MTHPDIERWPGLTVYTPERWLPQFYRPSWLVRWTARRRVRSAREVLVRQGCTQIVAYLWRPQFAHVLDDAEWDLSCYHIDDEYAFSDPDSPVSRHEARLLSGVDQVFIHSPALMKKKGDFNPHTRFMPNGVDYELYARPAPEPPDLGAIDRPRIGYTGFLKQQLDWSLIADLAERHPDWSFVFVGPMRPHSGLREKLDELALKPNIYFLGEKKVELLASYPRHFDVCIMPYEVGGYTNFIYPMKLHEYLASGCAVVGSPIRSLQDFQETVLLAEGTEEWSQALRQALALTGNDEQRAKRQAVAREHDWDTLVDRIKAVLIERLDFLRTSSDSNRA